MILNSYAVLAAAVALLQLLVSLLVLGLAVSARPTLVRDALEDRGYLVFLLALLLVGLSVASWPLLYLLLQSYVAEWPGVMCIYGVTQVGVDSTGPGRYLPGLLKLLQLTKPLLVFAGGAWFALYLLNRRARTGPLLGRLFVVLIPLGLLAAADAAAELAYIGIPKKEEFPPGGCCTVAADAPSAARFLPPVLIEGAGKSWLAGAYYAGNLALILALAVATRRSGAAPGWLGLALLLLGGVVNLAVSGLFLVEIASPALLRLPYHHCAYDLLPRAPEGVAAVTLYLAGCFSLGWAGVARWLGRRPETEPLLPRTIWRYLCFSLWAYTTSFGMMALELALA